MGNTFGRAPKFFLCFTFFYLLLLLMYSLSSVQWCPLLQKTKEGWITLTGLSMQLGWELGRDPSLHFCRGPQSMPASPDVPSSPATWAG